MSIKRRRLDNEIGLTDLSLTLTTNSLALVDGAAAAPSLYFTSSPTTGIYSSAADNFDVTVNGVQTLNVNSSGTTIKSGVLSLPDGATGVPSLTYTGATNFGWYRPSAGKLRLTSSVGGDSVEIDGTGGTSTILTVNSLGVEGNPEYAFIGDETTGFGWSSAGATYISSSGDVILRSDPTGITVVPTGTAGAPSLRFSTDTTTGLYRSAANEISASLSGSQKWKMSSTGFQLVTGTLTVPAGSASNCAVNFGTANTGFYSSGGQLVTAVGGSDCLYMAQFYTQVKANAGNLAFCVGNDGTSGWGGSTGVNTYYNSGTAMAQYDSTGLTMVNSSAVVKPYLATATQLTDLTTGVTCNGQVNQITLAGSVLVAHNSVSFTLTNSTITATSGLLCTLYQSTDDAGVCLSAHPSSIAAGSALITLWNTGGSDTSHALFLTVMVLK